MVSAKRVRLILQAFEGGVDVDTVARSRNMQREDVVRILLAHGLEVEGRVREGMASSRREIHPQAEVMSFAEFNGCLYDDTGVGMRYGQPSARKR